jgi:hypothetical protein
MREGRENIQFPAPIGCAHLVPEFPFECSPCSLIRCSLRVVDEFSAG